jgi:hypothetical protein
VDNVNVTLAKDKNIGNETTSKPSGPTRLNQPGVRWGSLAYHVPASQFDLAPALEVLVGRKRHVLSLVFSCTISPTHPLGEPRASETMARVSRPPITYAQQAVGPVLGLAPDASGVMAGETSRD